MNDDQNVDEAIGILQELGLKEYEARCFVGLTRLSDGTAKELSEITEVPRTRVYDAIRVLETQGLVEIQHTTPQQFRAVPLEEATSTLRDRNESRVDRLQETLEGVQTTEPEDATKVQEVWSMTGSNAIENRANKLIGEATGEVVLVVGEESLFTEDLAATLGDLDDRVDLIVGSLTEELEAKIHDRVPDARTFVSDLEWLHASDDDETAVGRLMLIDRSSLLVSSIVPDSGEERAVFGTGQGNGMVVIARRLIAQGLVVPEATENGVS